MGALLNYCLYTPHNAINDFADLKYNFYRTTLWVCVSITLLCIVSKRKKYIIERFLILV